MVKAKRKTKAKQARKTGKKAKPIKVLKKKRAAPNSETSPRGETIVASGTRSAPNSKNWFSSPPVPWNTKKMGLPSAPGFTRCR